VKWLLSKAYNNKVPENLREPFYRDQEVMCFALFLVITVMLYQCRKNVDMKSQYKEYASEKYWSLVVKLRLSKEDETVSFSELMIVVFRIFTKE
jgi:uncharacterized protein YsxB (DUF464 family)